ncbi:MAG: carbamoyltransferase HypF [Bryobacteraceae bacterium]|nr:carbamoyltransferase HypF [Bryobacteraceae bacterium]
MDLKATRLRISLAGALQGVGFRPFVHNLAVPMGLAGWVRNTASGALIEVEGTQPALDDFRRRLRAELPPAAMILAEEFSWLAPSGVAGFEIQASEPSELKTAVILPDLATCPACLREMRTPGERRFGYAFTNCTRCGPRYTIVEAIPYDRPNTTMARFELCEACRAEYTDPRDRRFHAQPIACPMCGPRLSVSIESAAAVLRGGGILALKGIGGYQLLCDAGDEPAVLRLRERKLREWKPFAVMAPSVEQLRRHARVSDEEAALLESAAAPIVLLEAMDGTGLAPAVRRGSPWLGAMLPYSPLHHLLMEAFPHPVVCTSGNLSDEPIAIANGEAQERLGAVADGFLDHDRPVARPCDDSVARITAGRTTLLRRARGYAPMPVWTGRAMPKVLALGGHLKSTVALAVGRQVVVSQHIGDLDSPESRDAFVRTIEDLCRLYEFSPDVVACDLHPDYFSTVHASSFGCQVRHVQHHHAHAASCIAENGLEGAVLAVTWDGTGLGTDGTIWGGEIFIVEGWQFERVAHLRPFLLPGGDAAMKDCSRPASGILHEIGRPSPHLTILERRLNCVETTSVGRLFDALAYLGGFTDRNHFEGEAGLLMEAAAMRESAGRAVPMPEGDWRELAAEFIDRPSARMLHDSLAGWIVETTLETRVKQVALSGGCFQNALLVSLVVDALERRGIRVATHQRVPANDGGISLGQAVLAALDRYSAV